MNLRAKLIILSIYFSIFVISDMLATANPIEESSAKDIIEKFCNAEFMGVQDIRLDIAHYSKKRKKFEEKNDPEFNGLVKYWENDPVFIVESYQIINISVKKNHAIAIIKYKLLAQTKGNGALNREFITVSNKSELVNLHLIYDSLKWSVIDPPAPRVSIQAIIEYYKKILEIMGNDWLQRDNISKEQKQYYSKVQKDIEILTNLQRNPN